MSWKRFISYLLLGTVLSGIVACSQSIHLAATGVAVPSSTSLSTPVQRAQTTTESLVAGIPNPPRGDVRMVVMSDLNGAYGATDYDLEVDKAIQLIPFWQPDLVVCSGDMVAGQKPSLSVAQIQAMWRAFDQHVAAPLRDAGLPYGFTVGNHDASGSLDRQNQYRFQRERDLAAAYWNHPEHDPGLVFVDRYEFPFYYSFQYEEIFFVVWDGSASRMPQAKLDWVQRTLASESAQQAKMRVLLGHLPLYAVSEGRDRPGEVMDRADDLRAMLERYDVHTYISGHHHAYYPGRRGDLQLLHAGALGGGLRPLIGEATPARKSLTVVDVDLEPALTRYTTYDMQSLETIELESLPRLLTGHNGVVLRRDVAWEALSAAEKSACQRLGPLVCGF